MGPSTTPPVATCVLLQGLSLSQYSFLICVSPINPLLGSWSEDRRGEATLWRLALNERLHAYYFLHSLLGRLFLPANRADRGTYLYFFLHLVCLPDALSPFHILHPPPHLRIKTGAVNGLPLPKAGRPLTFS